MCRFLHRHVSRRICVTAAPDGSTATVDRAVRTECAGDRVRSLLFPRSIAIVGASPRHAEPVANDAAQRRHGVGREPEPRRGGRPALLPDGRRPAGDARSWPSCSSTTSGWRTRSRMPLAAGVRAFVVPGVGAEAGAAGSDVATRLAAAAQAAGAVAARPELHGDVRSGRPCGLDRRRARRRRRRVTSRCSASPARSPTLSSRSAAASACAASSRPAARPSRTRPTTSTFFAAGRGHARRRALPRDGTPPGRVRRCARGVRCRGQAGRLPQGRPLRGGRARGAVAHGSTRRLGARVLGPAAPLRSDRGGGLPRARRDARDPRSPPLAARHAHRRGLRVGWRVRAARRPRRGGGHPVPAAAGASSPTRCTAEFPNYLDPGNPLDAWAVADEQVVYPRSLELLARVGRVRRAARARRPVAVSRRRATRTGAS